MEPQQVFWLSRRLLTHEEMKLIRAVHGDAVIITSDRSPLGNDPAAFIEYLDRHGNAFVYTNETTIRQLTDALAAGKRFGFLEYSEGRFVSVLHADTESRSLISVQEAPDTVIPAPTT